MKIVTQTKNGYLLEATHEELQEYCGWGFPGGPNTMITAPGSTIPLAPLRKLWRAIAKEADGLTTAATYLPKRAEQLTEIIDKVIDKLEKT